MPGFMRRTMSYLGLVEEYDEDDYDTGYDAAYENRRERDRERDRGDDRRRVQVGADREGAGDRVRERERPSLAPVAERHPAPQSADADREAQSTDLSRIATVHPSAYSDARKIGERFRSGSPVIMNLTDLEDADAKRLVDFAAGLIFGRRGSMDRITSRVFLLSPPEIEVSAEDKARIVENGFFTSNHG